MRFSHFFIDRPIFASVLSIIILIVGAIAQRNLPIAEYPEIAPPTVNVTATYPGASAEVIAATVATPLELEINGVDDMLYINSQSTGDGRLSINVVFKPGVDIDQAQVLVQNRVAVAQPRLPRGRAAAGRRGAQGLARPDDGRAHDLARRQPRPAVHLQLRHALREGRAGPRRRRRQRAGVRRARLFDARLARSGPRRRPQSDGRRSGRWRCGPPTCRSPPAPSTRRPPYRPAPSPCRSRRWAA